MSNNNNNSLHFHLDSYCGHSLQPSLGSVKDYETGSTRKMIIWHENKHGFEIATFKGKGCPSPVLIVLFESLIE